MPNPAPISSEQDVIHIKGDEDRGYATDTRLTKTALGRPTYRYGDRFVTCEVYRDPVTKLLGVHTICPRCQNTLWIREPNKRIDYDAATNTLSIEPFECTWELGRGTDATRNDRIISGVGLCRLRLGIQRNVARNAR